MLEITEEINFFIREEPYGFLSNFERTPFTVDEVLYLTNEHYYQSNKPIDPIHQKYIRDAPKATVAMVLGRSYEHNKYLQKYMKPHWDLIKLRVMLTGLRAKFYVPTLCTMLLETGDSILHENNDEDPFWGIGDGTGSSWLGKLLMVVREEKRRGWVCGDFRHARCDGDPNERRYQNCPDKMCEICFEIADYEMIHEP